MRLFFAIEFPKSVKDELCATMDKMRPCCAKGRFVQHDNLHLTLAFLGEVPPVRLPEVKEAMNAVSARPFSLQIGGMGCFRQHGGDLYWAGVEHSVPLGSLYRSLCAELQKHGFRTESRSYLPHLTLVRQAVLKENCDHSVFNVPVMRMEVEKFSLMLSERRDGKPVYTELASRSLEGVQK